MQINTMQNHQFILKKYRQNKPETSLYPVVLSGGLINYQEKQYHCFISNNILFTAI